MGLDQYAYTRLEGRCNSDEDISIMEWRKHNRLQGWMQNLWESKGCPNAQTDGDEMGEFNLVELELTSTDIDDLESAINNFELPESNGFFWGSDSYFWNDENDEPFPDNEYWYKETDLRFVNEARKAINNKNRVFYSCWY